MNMQMNVGMNGNMGMGMGYNQPYVQETVTVNTYGGGGYYAQPAIIAPQPQVVIVE